MAFNPVQKSIGTPKFYCGKIAIEIYEKCIILELTPNNLHFGLYAPIIFLPTLYLNLLIYSLLQSLLYSQSLQLFTSN